MKEYYIIKIHCIPKQEAIEMGHKEHDWFYGKEEISLGEYPDGYSHPETGFLTTKEYLIKSYGYTRKCDAVRKINFLKQYKERYWNKEYEIIVVTVQSPQKGIGIMMKLNKQVEALEKMQDKIQEKIDQLQEKMDAIEDHAGDMDRDLTQSEQDRFDHYEEQIQELECESDDIQNAIDYLLDYCE